jgi:NAD(P)-dependent dehydrogenase (short-subunit alcohol dehydrogenase family)
MLKGRSAIITGANQGLGKEIARAFAAAGAAVALVARDRELLDLAAQELTAEGPGRRILTFAADVTDEKVMKEVIGSTIKEFGKLDILVNNAGVYGPKGPLEEIDLAEWRRALDINVMGTLIPTRLVLSHFKANHYGKIINLSGGGATNPMPLITAYASSKAAVVRFSESMALELKDFGIDVNAVAPGALNTRLLDEILAAGPEKVGATFYKRSLEQQKSGGASMVTAANLCVYLASKTSDGVTGRLISAIWDEWATLAERLPQYKDTDVYALRRITAKDRGFDWDVK